MKSKSTELRSALKMGQMGVALVLVLALSSHLCAQGASQEFWPSAKLNLGLGKKAGIQVVGEKQSGEDISRTQRKFSVIGTYRVKRMVSLLEENIDEEKNHNLVLGAGYEYLDTNDNGSIKRENRLVVQGTPNVRIKSLKFLLQDRNRVEFRWNGGTYSTRYRNKLTVERTLKVDRFEITPYTSGELFYDQKYKDWIENQYAFGLIWPYKKLLSIDTFYLRQNCTTCKEVHVNAVGLTVTVFWKLVGKEK